MIKTNKNLKYIILTVIFGITYGLWFFTKIVIEKQSLTLDPLTNIAQLLGLTALIQFVINFLLATRAYFIESLFGGLDKMYKFHKANARYAFIFAWAHPILLALRGFTGIESVKLYFLPSLQNEFRYNIGMFALYVMTILVLLSLTKYLPYQIWKNLHRFMILVMVFLFIHVITAPGTAESGVLLKVWITSCTLVGILCWLYVELIYRRFGPVFYYKVSRVNKMGPINELYLEPQNKPLTYHAGQYAFMSFLNNKDIKSEFHPFGLSSNPHEYHIRISAKIVGDYTSTLEKAKPGDLVKLIGPYGFFTRDRLINFKKQIWIAGGIGITPFLSMLAMEKDEPTGNKIDFFYTAKTESEAVYKDEILKGSENISDLKINFNTDDKDGFLSAKKIIDKLDFDIKEAHILLCGPPGMMYALEKQFIELGLPKDQIIFEDFALKPV